MKNVVKQVVGIDVAQDELVVCFGIMYEDLTSALIAHKVFANTQRGFDSLLGIVNKLFVKEVATRFVMEATGVYHESFAYYLHEQNFPVSIILPNKISNYARSLEVKTVTDKTASEAIAMFGLERRLDNWEPPQGIYRNLQQLTREREQIVADRVVTKNQIHAEQAGAYPNKKSIARANKRQALLNDQEKEIKEELSDLIRTNDEVKQIVLLLCTIPGVGLLTAATVLGETNGFNLIRNKRQLTSYAGLDVKEKQSGTSVKGKPCISKKGNKQLRKSMHMPALSAIRHDERFKATFARLVSKHGIKMKAAVAVQRKLLEMIYTIYKTKTAYDKDYFKNQNEAENMISEQKITVKK